MTEDERATADDFEESPVTSIASDGNNATHHPENGKSKNAFTELMRAKSKPSSTNTSSAQPRLEPDRRTQQTRFMGREGLGAYTVDPASFPRDRVVQYDDDFVVIRDLYPKASIHLLILPRDAKRNFSRGQEAFDDVAFLDKCRAKERQVRGWVAEELRARFGRESAAEAIRRQAMDGDVEANESGGHDSESSLPQGRDWEAEVISGVHAIPSMSHLHIHVLSRDMVSGWMKKSNHYLSFTTDFLIPLRVFPLPRDDYRRRFGHWTDSELRCWRCNRGFGKGAPAMRLLKPHLDEEFEAWKRE